MKNNAEYQLNFIKKIIDKFGPRLPGSIEETRAAQYIGKEMTKATGKRSIIERFRCAPLASVASVPLIGFALIAIAVPLYLFLPIGAVVVIMLILIFGIFQPLLFSGDFDFLFPKRISHNVYNILDPPEKKVDFTLILSGHIDSSWLWNLTLKHPHRMWGEMLYAVLSVLALLVVSFLKVLSSYGIITLQGIWIWWILIPIVPGFFLFMNFLSWDKSVASPGAGDNLSGISTVLWLAKYFKENPNKVPKNCRIIFAGFGSEEAGLKGSFEFVRRHRKDLLKENVWVINMDGIADSKNFHIMTGDFFIGTKYDKEYIKLAEKAMKKAKIKFGKARMPVGGTDASPFSRAGIKSLSLVAQKVGPIETYHTYNDIPENLDPLALIQTNKVVLNLIEEINKNVHKKYKPEVIYSPMHSI